MIASRSLIGRRVRLRYDIQTRDGSAQFKAGEVVYVEGIWRRTVHLIDRLTAPGASPYDGKCRYIRRVEVGAIELVDTISYFVDFTSAEGRVAKVRMTVHDDKITHWRDQYGDEIYRPSRARTFGRAVLMLLKRFPLPPGASLELNISADKPPKET